MLLSFIYALVRLQLDLVRLGTRWAAELEIELIALRHENTALRRQFKRPRLHVFDRVIFAALGDTCPPIDCGSRWPPCSAHREFARRRFSRRRRPGRPRLATEVRELIPTRTASAAATPMTVPVFITGWNGLGADCSSGLCDSLLRFHMPNFTFDGVPDNELFEGMVTSAKAAEAAGFDLGTVMDHFYQIGGIGSETEPMLDAYSTLAALAAHTTRVRLATLVTGVTYRNPALLAKMVTTLDIISKGRAVLGIGAAWNKSEHVGYGFEFPPIAERMDRLDETLTIAKLMFTQERPSFEGRYYRIDRALNSPRPIQPGGPKILVGGSGEKRTLRILARHGDIGHWFFGPIEDIAERRALASVVDAALRVERSHVPRRLPAVRQD